MSHFNLSKISSGHHPNRQPSFLELSKDLHSSQQPLQKRKAGLPELISGNERYLSLRQCCKIKEDVRYSISRQNKIRRSKLHSRVRRLPWENAQEEPVKKKKKEYVGVKDVKTIKKEKKNVQKNHLYILPRLKEFNSEDFNENQSQNQTKHKITNQIRPKRLLTEGSYQNYAVGDLKDRHRNYSQMQSGLRSRDEDYHRLHRQHQMSSRAKAVEEKDDTNETNVTGPYYKYIENYPTVKKQPQPRTYNRRHLNFEDQPRSIPSQLKNTTRKDSNTLFHQNKIKYSQPKMTKSSLSFSQFKQIPHSEQQLSSFLLNYRPLDPKFDLKGLVKEGNFQIINKQTEIYVGLMEDGLKQGKGVIMTKNYLFEGIFSNDQKIKGCQKNQNGVYKGTFKQNKRHGRGQFEWSNGQTFQGEWKNGKKDGHGIWRSPKGNFYEGQWKNNKQNGKGIYMHIGGSKYTGYFKDFLKHGRGQEQFQNGDQYSGQYKDGKPHGYGKYLWKNGDRYQGEFVNGSREGKGILVKADRVTFEGEFQNDLKHGKGKEKYPNGQYFQGEFKEGDKVRGKLYNAKGQLIEDIQ